MKDAHLAGGELSTSSRGAIRRLRGHITSCMSVGGVSVPGMSSAASSRPATTPTRTPGAPASREASGWQDAAAKVIEALAGPGARLREDQAHAVAALAGDGARVLVVQATGWGKSAVYWCATAARRAAGAGPTLVVSPLLALMRDQVEAASRAGLRAVTINSANIDDWSGIERELLDDQVDVLLVSPERLANPTFGRRVLRAISGRLGLLVIDEAHAISDWGHDFRPDYRRVTDVLGRLDRSVPVLATTATANARVTADVAAQLGDATTVLRGPLGRDSLQLAVTPHLTPLERLAWVADHLPAQAGSGIVYALTVADAQRATAAIRAVHGQDYPVGTYTGRLDPEQREHLEDALRRNEVKALVATSALGMGYDKPDLGFVVHLGSPPSPVSYYQQVGRAGRGIDHALVVLLPAHADEGVWRHFATATLPREDMARRLLDALGPGGNDPGRGDPQDGPDGAGDGTGDSYAAGGDDPADAPPRAHTVVSLESATGLRRGRIELLLKQLAVDGAVDRTPDGWVATGRPWHYDAAHYQGIVAVREREATIMRDYLAGRSCLMELLRASLDDEGSGPCGRCSVCLGQLPEPLAEAPAPDTVATVARALRGVDHPYEPRKMWPGGAFGKKGRIPPGEAAEQGRVLIEMDAPEWEQAARDCLDRPGDAPPELLDALVGVLARWSRQWGRRPDVVVSYATRYADVDGSHPYPLAAQAAEHLASVGRLPAGHWHVRPPPSEPGGERPSGSAEAAAWQRALDAAGPPEDIAGRCVLLVVDASASGWPVTLAAAALRRAGADEVLPLVIRREP